MTAPRTVIIRSRAEREAIRASLRTDLLWIGTCLLFAIAGACCAGWRL